MDDNRTSSLESIRNVLLCTGYTAKGIVQDYDFAAPNGHTTSQRIDMVAFSDPFRHDLHTSCIAVHQLDPGTDVCQFLSRLSFLAVPLALVVKGSEVDLWPVTSATRKRPAQPVHLLHDEVATFFSNHEEDLQPHAMVAAKTGARQFSFFDFDDSLLEFAYEATKKILVRHFRDSVAIGQDFLKQQGATEEGAKADVIKVALQLLAASILEDKRLLGENRRSSSARELVRRAANKYNHYFDVALLTSMTERTLDEMWTVLRNNVTFRSFTNEMLGYFYEHAFVDDRLRKELGIYYTPRSIAKRIFERLPIEDIHPSRRVVFDGACGSGNLLVAAYERLASLLPGNWDSTRAHEYLVQRIKGVDVQPFATQVAGLSLFFMNLPSGDSWDITSADFLCTPNESNSLSPTILIGNPPFRESRSVRGKREQAATAFLDRYLDLLPPDGLLGIVLPETFVENSSCRSSRQRLLSECDLLEMWHLPEGVFPMSQVATVVVLAKKLHAEKANNTGPVRIERVRSLSEERSRFLHDGTPSFSYVIRSPSVWLDRADNVMFSSPLDKDLWVRTRDKGKLGEVAYVKNGINVSPDHRDDIQDQEELTHRLGAAYPSAEWRPWLPGPGSFEPYLLTPKRPQFVKYPGRLERPRPRLKAVFERPNAKVLVHSARAPGNPWRVYAAIDDIGYFPSKAIYCILPRSGNVTLFELVATLNNPIASAWIDSRNRRRWIGRSVLEQLPFPRFAPEQKHEIAELVTELMNLKKLALAVPSERLFAQVRSLVNAVDSVVYSAFGLPESAQSALMRFMQGYRRPGAEWAYLGQPACMTNRRSCPDRRWAITGQAISVSEQGDRMTLWIRGYNEDQPFETTIPPSMPGWVMRTETAFQAVVPWEDRHSKELPVSKMEGFRPLEFSYLSTDDLTELVTQQDEARLNRMYELESGNG